MEVILSNNHWQLENYKQRMTSQQWRAVLIAGNDMVIFRGHMRQLKAKNLGYGVVEVYKEAREGGGDE